jgi:hypothetical protein
MYTSGRTIGTVLERLTQKVQIRTTKVLKKHKIIFGKRFLDPQSGKNDFSSLDLVACHTLAGHIPSHLQSAVECRTRKNNGLASACESCETGGFC